MTRIAVAIGSIVIALLTYVVAAAPAQASTLCKTTSNAYQYDRIGGNYQFTLHAGRGYRMYSYSLDTRGRIWLYGHGAEHPTVNGWILRTHTNCPIWV